MTTTSLSAPTRPLLSPPASTRLVDVPRPILYGALAWLGLAIALAASGVLPHALPLVPVLLLLATCGTIVTWRRSPAFQRWTAGLDLRLPILFHVTRIVFGTLFLIELAADRLPATFAERGGVGDILAGALAIVAALAAGRPRPPDQGPQVRSPSRRALVWAFTVIGLVDIIMVVMTAQVGALVDHEPRLVAVLGTLPYSLLPTVVVPLVILTHVLVAQRLRADRPRH